SATHQVSHQCNILTRHDSTSYHTMFDATQIALSALSNNVPRLIRMAKYSASIVFSVRDRVNTRQHVHCTSRFPLPALCIIKGSKGFAVSGRSPASLMERWRVSNDG